MDQKNYFTLTLKEINKIFDLANCIIFFHRSATWRPSIYVPSITWLFRALRLRCSCRQCTSPAWIRPITTECTARTRFTSMEAWYTLRTKIPADCCYAALRKLATSTRSIRKSSSAHRRRIPYRHVVSCHSCKPITPQPNWSICLPTPNPVSPLFPFHFISDCSYAILRLEPEELFQHIFREIRSGELANPARRPRGARSNGHTGGFAGANWGCIWNQLRNWNGRPSDVTFQGVKRAKGANGAKGTSGGAASRHSTPVQLWRLQGERTATGLARVEDTGAGLSVCYQLVKSISNSKPISLVSRIFI